MPEEPDMQTLSNVAQQLLRELRVRLRGLITVREEVKLKDSHTKGWRVELGSLGQGEPRLEIWFDRWTGSSGRRLWYGFYAAQALKLSKRVETLKDHLKPQRHFSEEDMRETGREEWVLKVALKEDEFNSPHYEEYKEYTARYSYYGQFDPVEPHTDQEKAVAARRAAVFFEEVIRKWQVDSTSDGEDGSDDYSEIENRRSVRQHIARERNSALAEARKIQDGYRCTVCEMSFVEVYGSIGQHFAEAHHIVPLSRIERVTTTSLRDLVTVCSNCHRMLHKLDGEAGDIEKLKQMMTRQ